MKKVIVTGQQIGLLGGPLYTAYKVLGAVCLAAELSGEAVYWLETNDADFSEINHIDYLDAEGRLKTLTWDIDSRGYSCGLIEVDNTLVAVLETFFSSLRQTEFTPVLKEMALECYVPGRTLGEASLKLAKELYGFLDLRLFTPAEEDFREFSRPILLREAERTTPGEQCNLFCLVGNRREALFKQITSGDTSHPEINRTKKKFFGGPGGDFLKKPPGRRRQEYKYSLRDGTIVDLDQYELLPNVKTRNLCQDAYFSTHTYVAGPGEIKYIAELDPVYRFHGVKKGLLQPRMSLTLIEPRVSRLLKKTGLALEEALALDKATLMQKALKEKSGFDLKEAQKEADALTRTYLEKLEKLGLQTKETGRLLRGAVKQALGEKRASEKKKHEQLIESAQFLADNLQPFGKKQERVFNLFYYMNLFGGKEFIHKLYENYDFSRTTMEIGR